MLNNFNRQFIAVCFLGFFILSIVLPKISISQTENASIYNGSANQVASGLTGIRMNAVASEISLEGMGRMGNARLLYSQIKGSPFLNDNFQLASLYNKENKPLGKYMVRYNLASKQFHFISDDKVELEVPENIVGRIIILNADNKPLAIYSNGIVGIAINGIKVDKYVEILAEGEATFFKYAYKHVISKESTLNPFPEYSFALSTNYFIRIGNEIKNIKKLNEDNIVKILPKKNENQSKLNYNFKNESDVAAYIANWNKISVGKK